MFIDNRLGMVESLETMRAHEERLNKVANNIANADTPGFRKEGVTFWEMLYTMSSGRQRVGKALEATTDFRQGAVEETGNPLDLAINGRGFFKVQTPQGVRYTRAGNFQLNAQGQLVTPDGYLVLGDGGPVVIQGGSVSFGRDGTIAVDGQQLGQLAVVDFPDPAALRKAGQNLFAARDQTVQEQPVASPLVRQGYLEKSNVNTMEEMTALIDLYRAFEGQQKMIQAVDDMDGMAVRQVGGLNQ